MTARRAALPAAIRENFGAIAGAAVLGLFWPDLIRLFCTAIVIASAAVSP